MFHFLLLVIALGIWEAGPVGRALRWIVGISGACAFIFVILWVSLVVFWERKTLLEARSRFLTEIGFKSEEKGRIHTEDLAKERDRVERTHAKIIAWVVIHQALSWLFFGLGVALGKCLGVDTIPAWFAVVPIPVLLIGKFREVHFIKELRHFDGDEAIGFHELVGQDFSCEDERGHRKIPEFPFFSSFAVGLDASSDGIAVAQAFLLEHETHSRFVANWNTGPLAPLFDTVARATHLWGLMAVFLAVSNLLELGLSILSYTPELTAAEAAASAGYGGVQVRLRDASRRFFEQLKFTVLGDEFEHLNGSYHPLSFYNDKRVYRKGGKTDSEDNMVETGSKPVCLFFSGGKWKLSDTEFDIGIHSFTEPSPDKWMLEFPADEHEPEEGDDADIEPPLGKWMWTSCVAANCGQGCSYECTVERDVEPMEKTLMTSLFVRHFFRVIDVLTCGGIRGGNETYYDGLNKVVKDLVGHDGFRGLIQECPEVCFIIIKFGCSALVQINLTLTLIMTSGRGISHSFVLMASLTISMLTGLVKTWKVMNIGTKILLMPVEFQKGEEKKHLVVNVSKAIIAMPIIFFMPILISATIARIIGTEVCEDHVFGITTGCVTVS